jgi:hypothetical protein
MLKVVQIAANPLRREIQAMGDLASRPDFITHSAFGGPGFPQRLARIISADPVLANLATELGYKERDTIDAAAMLTDYALALNPHGVVLMSMFRNDHLLANVARAAQPSNGEIVQLLERALPGLCGL